MEIAHRFGANLERLGLDDRRKTAAVLAHNLTIAAREIQIRSREEGADCQKLLAKAIGVLEVMHPLSAYIAALQDGSPTWEGHALARDLFERAERHGVTGILAGAVQMTGADLI